MVTGPLLRLCLMGQLPNTYHSLQHGWHGNINIVGTGHAQQVAGGHIISQYTL